MKLVDDKLDSQLRLSAHLFHKLLRVGDISRISGLDLLYYTHQEELEHLLKECLRWVELLVEALDLDMPECEYRL